MLFVNCRQYWNLKYRSLWSILIMGSIFDSHWFFQSMMLIYQITFNICDWTMKNRSCWPSFIMRSKVVSHGFIITKYYVLPSKSRYIAKSTGPWNIGDCDLHLFSVQRSHYTDWRAGERSRSGGVRSVAPARAHIVERFSEEVFSQFMSSNYKCNTIHTL